MNNLKNKTVVYTWVTSVCNVTPDEQDGYWGMGDIISGMLSTYDICKEMGVIFHIDTTRSPVSQFVESIEHGLQFDWEKIPFIDRGEIETYIMTSKQSVITMINNEIRKTYSDQAKHAVQLTLTPNKKIREKIENTKKQLGLNTNYNVLHIRAGDTYMQNGGKGGINARGNNTIVDEVAKIADDDSWIVLTDSVDLKHQIKNYFPNLKQSASTKPVHTGLNHSVESLESTLLDFYIVCGSNSIRSITCYPHPSGFVAQPANIYNIPLEVIRL
jgi:hypothetical protein